MGIVQNNWALFFHKGRICPYQTNEFKFFYSKKCPKIWQVQKKSLPLHPLNKSNGAIAQLVEQRTENPCVPGSIPGGTTSEKANQVNKHKLIRHSEMNAVFCLQPYPQKSTGAPFVLVDGNVGVVKDRIAHHQGSADKVKVLMRGTKTIPPQ